MPSSVDDYLGRWEALSASDATALARRLIEDHALTGPLARRHPLGFIIFMFPTVPVSLRMHVWVPGDQSMQDSRLQIHDHAFDVRSRVICGSITNIRYSIREAPDGRYQKYSVAYDADSSELRPTGVFANADETERADYRVGDAYALESREFHKSDVPSGCLVATLVLPKSTSPGPPVVIGPRDGTLLTFRREVLSPDDGVRVARMVLEALRG